MAATSKRLLDFFLREKKISQEEASRVEKEVRGGRNEEEALLELSRVKEKDILEAKARIFGVPAVKLDANKVDPKLFEEVTEEAVRQYGLIPLAKRRGFFEFGLLDPDSVRSQEAAKFVASENGLFPKFYVVSRGDFNDIVKRYQGMKKEVEGALEELEAELGEKKQETRRRMERGEEARKITEEAPTAKVVGAILQNAVEGRASDIHIEPITEHLKVRFRIDGALFSSLLLPLHVHATVVSRIKILANLKIDETRIPQDGRFRMKINDKKIDFRVSTFPTIEGEKVVLRVLDPAAGLMTFPELGLKGRNLEVVTHSTAKPFGMVLISGPTGSGKTTTLYAILRLLNKEEVNVMSLEDPVEYYIDGVNQSQVRPEIGYDFANGLRHMVRQDPDIIMVGEIRDKETSALATHAALTGHVVLSTIHTNNAVGIIPRLIDMGVDPYLIPPSLALGVAQRLVRKLCARCKRKIKPNGVALEIIIKVLESFPPRYKEEIPLASNIEIYEAVGCEECLKKGYLGRIAIFEAFEMTPELEKIIVTKPTESAVEEETKSQGMITMKQDGILKVLNGDTSLEEVLRVVE